MATPDPLAQRPRAYSYIRFSSAQQAEGDSLRRQTALAEEYARAHGLEIDRELTMHDLGVSAYSGANMEQGALGAFLTAAQGGLIPKGSFLLVESLDRVSRKTVSRAAHILQSICWAGIRVVTLNDNRIYDEASLDEDPMAFIMAVLVFARAHEESAMKSRRLKSVWGAKRKAAHEHAVTANVPGWLKLNEERKPVLIPERALVVRRIVKAYLRGQGVESIARSLNSDSVAPFGRAPIWNRSSVFKTLQSRALIGQVAFYSRGKSGKDADRILDREIDGYFPAVISQDEYDRVRERIGRNAGRSRDGTVRNILSGLGECPKCGRRMTRVAKGPKGGYPRLVCASAKVGKCEWVGVKLAPIEKLILERYSEIVSGMPSADDTIEAQLRNQQAAVDALEEQLETLMALLEKTPSESLGKRVQALDGHLLAARDRLQELNQSAEASESRIVGVKVEALGVACRARPVDLARVNGCLKELVESVVIDYTQGMLRFRWRHRGESEIMYAWPASAQ